MNMNYVKVLKYSILKTRERSEIWKEITDSVNSVANTKREPEKLMKKWLLAQQLYSVQTVFSDESLTGAHSFAAME